MHSFMYINRKAVQFLKARVRHYCLNRQTISDRELV